MIYHFPATLLRKSAIAENTTEMTFSVSEESFAFKAGQYVSIEVPSLAGEAIPDRFHNFSIASSPINPKEVSIVFRNSQSIYKTALLALPMGSIVNINGPKGVLILPEATEVPVILVAGGIGIAPFMSQIRHAVEAQSSQQIVLMYFNTRLETTAYRDELLALTQQNPRFVVSEYIGIPQKEMFAYYVQTMPDALWYVVGAPGMVAQVEQILAESGILDMHIKFEGFSGYAIRGETIA